VSTLVVPFPLFPVSSLFPFLRLRFAPSANSFLTKRYFRAFFADITLQQRLAQEAGVAFPDSLLTPRHMSCGSPLFSDGYLSRLKM